MAETYPDERISRREWLWVGAASVVVVALVSVPYLVGLANSTPEMTFGGFLFGMGDMNSYLAKMRLGAYDGWLFHILYTAEPHDGALVFTLFLAVGKLAAWLSGEGAAVSNGALIIAFHAMRVVFGFSLLMVLYRFMAAFFDAVSQRRMAWGLATLAGGLGWIPSSLAILGLIPGPVQTPVEFFIPETFTLLLLYGLPHVSLTRLLLLLGWLWLFRGVEQHRWRPVLAAGLAWGLMAFTVPFYGALLGVLIAGWLLALWIRQRRIPWDAFWRSAAAGGLTVVVLVYNFWVFATNPVFAAWSAQNDLPSPPLGQYLLAYGLILALAVPGVIRLLRSGMASRHLLLFTWPLTSAALVYSPINVQRRLLEGVIVPLAILATLGIWQLVGDRPEGKALGWRFKQVGMGVLLALMLPSMMLLVSGGVATASRGEWPVFHPASEMEMLSWLRDEAPTGRIVLASHAQSNIIPASAGVQTYLGLGPETINEPEKKIVAIEFFDGGMADSERLSLLRDVGIGYVVVGPHEQNPACAANCFDPSVLPLQPVFHNAEYVIYEVQQ